MTADKSGTARSKRKILSNFGLLKALSFSSLQNVGMREREWYLSNCLSCRLMEEEMKIELVLFSITIMCRN